ncbi:uncharacterized protein FIBRA_02525 [Fibroporia radiculosa]|uniref:Large ribosomal subunit protein mL54 n=1 Tax=Fibroporia radiculosa TaxID=599839 RepID=J4I939_9APHY|nr:uncharacterized protein FIBRA_02525 [Fibroporia radiculosa]CCM00491.1 predicted protein [Fibroporia radiculosa]
MSLLQRVVRRPPALNAWYPARRCYASESKPAASSSSANDSKKDDVEVVSKSSCPENTVLGGIAYLKSQSPVLAQADDAYPDWLWTLLEPKKLPEDGPGGKAEKYKLRRANRQRIRDQNFMKTQ